MRSQIIIHSRAEKLHYEIREIVQVAKQVEALGQPIIWENIGDPVQKGEQIPAWIKQIVERAVRKDESYAYAPTKGLEATREFLAKRTNQRRKTKITKEDIVFFNGLGDAVGKIYGTLDPTIRVIGPTPAYSTHSSAEAAHTGSPHLTYKLDPKNKWLPDLEDLEMKVRYNPTIGGILLINPNNPTGTVYPKEYLQKIVTIAKKYDVFLIADEIYESLSYARKPFTPISDVIDGVCSISMKGISKEVPWPGSRCGWLEFYNTDRDPVFQKYVKAITDSKMLEVSSTTLPQVVIPQILDDKRYKNSLVRRTAAYKNRAIKAVKILEKVKGVTVVQPEGAFYITIVLDKKLLRDDQKLSIKNQKIKRYIEERTRFPLALDKRFVYYLLAATGICVVPLTGFETAETGFRATLLEPDVKKLETTFRTLAVAITEYLQS
ncbi:MAG: pyridoxal phosphate-dependent aminotransferase [Patescibacteria group bacterium]